MSDTPPRKPRRARSAPITKQHLQAITDASSTIWTGDPSVHPSWLDDALLAEEMKAFQQAKFKD
jgi:hypothetical protein